MTIAPAAVLFSSLLLCCSCSFGAPAADANPSEPSYALFKIAVYSGPSADRSSMALSSSGQLSLTDASIPALASAAQGNPSLGDSVFEATNHIGYLASDEADCSGPSAACIHTLTPGEATTGVKVSIHHQAPELYKVSVSLSELTSIRTFSSPDSKGGSSTIQLIDTDNLTSTNYLHAPHSNESIRVGQLHVLPTADHAETYYIVEATRLR